jgi:hypothetical protein
MMSLRYGIFCLLLCFVLLLLGLKNYELWTRPLGEAVEGREIKRADAKTEGPTLLGSQKTPTPVASYIFIADKNIFSPERKEFSITGITGIDQSNPMTRPQVILYGVTISKDYQSATIVNPGRPLRKGEREMMTLTIGDRVGEYKLAKILPDRITMEAGEDSFEVLLFDSSVPKKRTITRTETKPAEITSTSPAAAPVPKAAPAAVPKAAAAAPKPAERPRERIIEPPLPRPVRPVTPAPAPYPGTYPGRRPVRPYTPPGSEGR